MTLSSPSCPPPSLEPAASAEIPRSAPGPLETRSAVVVVGDAEAADGVCSTLRRICGVVHHVPTVAAALESRRLHARAHVLVPPLPKAALEDAVTRLCFAGPVFVVVPEDFSDRRARGLYDAGTAAVFEWPSEALLLPRMLQERLRPLVRRRATPTDGDEALARSIRARLELARPVMPPLDVEVDDGVVELEGRIDSVWKKERVCQMIAHVPGVRAVLDDTVEVVPPHRPDADIERDVQGVLEILLGDALRTISCSVDDGAVVLVGNMASRDDVERLLSFIGNVRGVRAIRNLVTVSPTAHRRDRGLTERLSTALQHIYPDSTLRVACFGPVAVVGGRVPRLSTKHEVEGLLARQDGIERVVNKIEIDGP
ncbi:MAG: BON domain-containing protein [Myxococcales bacterium]|nr:BON domain-containing protein [Myxococcales bacterium]